MQSEIKHLYEALNRHDAQVNQQNSVFLNRHPPPRLSLTERMSKWIGGFFQYTFDQSKEPNAQNV